MPEFKLVIGDPKTGKSYQKVITEDVFVGKKINETVSGDTFGFKGYEFKIRGGSDTAGIPMKQGLDTVARRHPILSEGPGFKPKKARKPHSQSHYFIQKRKTVRGHVIGSNITQINLVITKTGTKKIDELLSTPVEAPKESEAPPAEAPKEEAKPKEEKPAEKKEEKKEPPKEEPPKEESKPAEKKEEAKSEAKKAPEKKE